jgi:hypothetical protein
MTTIPRFVAIAGQIREQLGGGQSVALTMIEARRRYEGWSREAVMHDLRGDHRLARVFGRDALALQLAASVAAQWGRAAGVRAISEEERRA